MFEKGKAHFSFVVSDVSNAADFYEERLGAQRLALDPQRSEHDLFGHQLILRGGRSGSPPELDLSRLDEMPHVGLVLSESDYAEIKERSGVPPELHRRVDTPFEHHCFFVVDPDNVVWEIKCFSVS